MSLRLGEQWAFIRITCLLFVVRASMIWILGEYAERIDNADELLGSFLEGFADEDTQVRRKMMILHLNNIIDCCCRSSCSY